MQKRKESLGIKVRSKFTHTHRRKKKEGKGSKKAYYEN